MKRIGFLCAAICLVLLLCACGGKSTDSTPTAAPTPEAVQGVTPAPNDTSTDISTDTSVDIQQQAAPDADAASTSDTNPTPAAVPTPTPEVPETPEPTPISTPEKRADTATIGIDCHMALANYDKLDSVLKDERFVPSSGVILADTQVELTGGESVYDVLQKACKQNKILIECTYTPGTRAAYVEGINNLYEFSCGDLSGWIYSVNGSFPSISCSEYKVSAGDVIRWRYTCDLGRDVKGE